MFYLYTIHIHTRLHIFPNMIVLYIYQFYYESEARFLSFFFFFFYNDPKIQSTLYS